MKITLKNWLMIVTISLLVGAGVGAGVGLVTMHPSTLNSSTNEGSTSQHK
jgi:hypothetical protein